MNGSWESNPDQAGMWVLPPSSTLRRHLDTQLDQQVGCHHRFFAARKLLGNSTLGRSFRGRLCFAGSFTETGRREPDSVVKALQWVDTSALLKRKNFRWEFENCQTFSLKS
jgi:hypothetical protein